jgi:hypothetical protein
VASGDTFTQSAQVRLSATGAGEVSLGPVGSIAGWRVTLVSVSTSTRVKEPTFKLYREAATQSNFLEGSFSGSQDASDTQHVVLPGSQLVGQWTGGDANALATLRITGEVL